MPTSPTLEAEEAVRVRAIGSALAIELGILSAVAMLVLVLVTTRLGRVDPVPDAACLLPRLATVATTHAPIDGALAACGASREEALEVWKAHQEAERIEGFVPRGSP